MSDDEKDIMDVEENKPVVVELKEEKRATSGQWTEITTKTEKREVSPPRKVQRTGRSRNDSESPPRRPAMHRNDSPSPPRRPRTQGVRNDSPSPPRRTRHSTTRNDSPSPPRRRPSTATQGRNDSPSPPRRSRSDRDKVQSSRDASPSPPRRVKHAPGLQSASDFGRTERELHSIKDEQLKRMAPEESGKNAETVYRDKRGKKLDMLNEFMRQQAVREGKEVQLAKAQYDWGRGTVQKEQAVEKAKELADMANQPFARRDDDVQLEQHRRDILREGDPMADYFQEKIEKKKKKNKKESSRPVYKGPSAPPNRFRIPPGYRWDGIDRGNGFENLVLSSGNKQAANEEYEHRWYVSDM